MITDRILINVYNLWINLQDHPQDKIGFAGYDYPVTGSSQSSESAHALAVNIDYQSKADFPDKIYNSEQKY